LIVAGLKLDHAALFLDLSTLSKHRNVPHRTKIAAEYSTRCPPGDFTHRSICDVSSSRNVSDFHSRGARFESCPKNQLLFQVYVRGFPQGASPQDIISNQRTIISFKTLSIHYVINLLKPTGHVMHHQFNIQQLYALHTLHLCVLYLSDNKQRLVPLTA
jgi:hypothetical protein